MISYFNEDTAFQFKGRRSNNAWLRKVAVLENRRIGALNIIFCSDPYLLTINRRYLGHNYYTDIITFDYCEGNVLSGDLFISVDTVRANAAGYGASFEDELRRVMVHGLLHLVGYDDHTPDQQQLMRRKEDESLDLLNQEG